MAQQNTKHTQSGHEIYEANTSKTQSCSSIPYPRLGVKSRPPPHTLEEFREIEGRENRKRRLKELWERLRIPAPHDCERPISSKTSRKGTERLTLEQAETLSAMYDSELRGHCAEHPSDLRSSELDWRKFKEYAEGKEVELWSIFHDELDLDGNGHLDARELAAALRKAGIALSQQTISDFLLALTSNSNSDFVSFQDFRDFLLLLPRKVSPAEIYQYYEVKKYMGDDGRGPARVTMEGDVSLSAEDKPPDSTMTSATHTNLTSVSSYRQHDAYNDEGEVEAEGGEEEEETHGWLDGRTALKFLLAGGIAGAMSRTCTAPFDRLKVFLITRPPSLGGATLSPHPGLGGLKTMGSAIARIYAEGGILAFWTGNGLSVAKIFPESAIKFFAYESSKRAFAKYWDGVEDVRDISGVSRFFSGGIGGISSQLSIYPIETLKTQMMSATNSQKRSLLHAVRYVWGLGGIRTYYRGLTIGLIGVFPYSAIDMSTFEALKLAYLKSTGKDEPGVMAMLAFGSVSGSVGATSVYPLNLVRTRLQASGSSGHPQRYTGILDVVHRTWERDGWRGFYRGLFPTLAKVVPSVSISYVVYEHSKRRLGV